MIISAQYTNKVEGGAVELRSAESGLPDSKTKMDKMSSVMLMILESYCVYEVDKQNMKI